MLLKELHDQLAQVNDLFEDIFAHLPESAQGLGWPEKQAEAVKLWGKLSISEIYEKIENGSM